MYVYYSDHSSPLFPVLNSPKLLVSSLASSVTADDLEELFSEFGQLQSYPLMHFDARGKPLGSGKNACT